MFLACTEKCYITDTIKLPTAKIRKYSTQKCNSIIEVPMCQKKKLFTSNRNNTKNMIQHKQ